MTIQQWHINAELASQRLDAILFRLAQFSPRHTRDLVSSGRVRVNHRAVMLGAPRLKKGDSLEILDEKLVPAHQPEQIPLIILHQTPDLFFIDKPAGLATHPGPGHPAGTLANALRGLGVPLSTCEGPYRPGIVHRLDIETSGVMVVAKNNEIHRQLSEHFCRHRILKRYLAWVVGLPSWTQTEVDAPLGRRRWRRKAYGVREDGRKAQTQFKVLCSSGEWTLVEAFPRTGRTHQIRSHLAYLGHPIVGDSLYGGGAPARRQAARLGMRRAALHAECLTSYEMQFEVHAPLPEDFQTLFACREIEVE